MAQSNQLAETKRSLLDGRTKVTIKPGDDAEADKVTTTKAASVEKSVQPKDAKLAAPAPQQQTTTPAAAEPEKNIMPAPHDTEDIDDTQLVADLASLAVHTEVQAASDVDPDYRPPTPKAEPAEPPVKPQPSAQKPAPKLGSAPVSVPQKHVSGPYDDVPDHLLPDADIEDLYGNQSSPQVFVSHHTGPGWIKVVLWLLVVLILVAAAVDVLLDSGFLPITGLPHTHFFQ